MNSCFPRNSIFSREIIRILLIRYICSFFVLYIFRSIEFFKYQFIEEKGYIVKNANVYLVTRELKRFCDKLRSILFGIHFTVILKI